MFTMGSAGSNWASLVDIKIDIKGHVSRSSFYVKYVYIAGTTLLAPGPFVLLVPFFKATFRDQLSLFHCGWDRTLGYKKCWSNTFALSLSLSLSLSLPLSLRARVCVGRR